MTAAAPKTNAAATTSASLFQPRWRTLLVATLVGLLLGSLWWFVQPNDYRATATVLINPLAAKQLGPGTEVIPVRTIENERLFAGSSTVRSPVGVQLPEAADAMTITIDDRADALRFTATADDPQLAEQIATIWSTTFVTERRKALVNQWTLSSVAIQRELDALGEQIVASTDDESVGELSVRRDAAALAVPEINQQLSLLRGSTAAELLGPSEPAARSRESGFAGRAMLGTLLGLLVGAVLAAVFGGPLLPKKKRAVDTAKPVASPLTASEPQAEAPAKVSPARPVVDDKVAAQEPAAAAPRSESLQLPSYLREALAPTPSAPSRPAAAATAATEPIETPASTTTPAASSPEAPAPAEPPPTRTSPPPVTTSPAPDAAKAPPAEPTPAPETPPQVATSPAPDVAETPAAPAETQRRRIAPVPDVARRPSKPRLRRVELDPPN